MPPSDRARRSGLGLRIVSAAVLAPPALAALYFGPPYSDVVIVALVGLGGLEWARLCGGGRLDRAGRILVATTLLAGLAGSLGRFELAGWLIAAGALASLVLASLVPAGPPDRPGRRDVAAWYGLGAAYLAAAALALLWLRADPIFGRAIVLWLIAAVIATDSGAYLVGRTLDGPRLAPRISPGKTWAGLAGGVAAAALVGLATVVVQDQDNYLGLALASGALAIVAQLGDLLESGLKRRFGAKDSGVLIPGHGGVLDRIDGMLAAALAVGILVWLSGAGF